ncbi:MAG: secretion system protein F [Pusillimonas sp.]|nr:secretion system protein F [Pusillimonas sp.]|tara:strand:- start:27465 stop:28538 length:1074 start_codon:yes stop_codon:yes gene_type:complete
MLENFELKLNKWLFSGNLRIELYETISLLLENGVVLSKAIKDIYLIESENGKKPKAVRALVLNSLRRGIERGQSLSSAMASWVPNQEVALIKAGETSGNLSAALKECAIIIRAKQDISGSVIGGVLYPLAILSVLIVLLYQIATRMVPQFARITPEETWTGASWVLAQIAYFVVNWGLVSLVSLLLFMVWVIWSLPNLYRPRIRIWLDQIPPWSIYRALHGSTFLLNISVMLKAGVRLQDVLILMARTGSPWVRSRIGAALEGINSGENLGEALQRTGYKFPDKRMVQYLRAVGDQDGFDEHLARFGEHWLSKSVAKVKNAFRIINAICVVILGALMLLVVVGIYSLQGAAQQSLGM